LIMQTPVLLAYGFRPFFLLTGIYAVVAVLGWMGFLFAGWPLPLGWSPFKWHSHEMLYGLVSAAIAGFLLTAVTNWTGSAPLRGRALLALVGLWLAGRVFMWLATWVPGWLVAAVDLSFLAFLTLYLLRVLLRFGNHRNLILAAVLAILWLGNLLMHMGFMTGTTAWLRIGEQLGFDLIILLMAVIAGRITPAFSANWLRLKGADPESVLRPAWVERTALISLAVLVPLDALGAPAVLVAVVVLVAAVSNAVRLGLWRGWLVRTEPLLWILHLAYAWIVAGLVLRFWVLSSGALPASLWQHTVGVGAIGILLLGVMTRVAMGHTGRALQLVKCGIWIYVAIIAAALLRVLTAAGILNFRVGLTLAALAWVLAFGLFVVLYWPILTSPRADGRPG
jgi:uncharacterized protein involved in response to NO